MNVQFFCQDCEAQWDIRDVNGDGAANVADLFDEIHCKCRTPNVARAVIPLAEVPVAAEPLDWSLNMTNGRLIGSHAAADASLALYQVWNDGDHWLAATMHEPLATGTLTECLDACQEHFTDARESDARAKQ